MPSSSLTVTSSPTSSYPPASTTVRASLSMTSWPGWRRETSSDGLAPTCILRPDDDDVDGAVGARAEERRVRARRLGQVVDLALEVDDLLARRHERVAEPLVLGGEHGAALGAGPVQGLPDRSSRRPPFRVARGRSLRPHRARLCACWSDDPNHQCQHTRSDARRRSRPADDGREVHVAPSPCRGRPGSGLARVGAWPTSRRARRSFLSETSRSPMASGDQSSESSTAGAPSGATG